MRRCSKAFSKEHKSYDLQMADKSFSSELDRARSRSDADILEQHLRAYYAQHRGEPVDGDLYEIAFDGIQNAPYDDTDKALAYVMLASGDYEDEDFLAFVACGPLESLLQNPSRETLERIVAEARKTARIRWMISLPFRHALPERVLAALGPYFMDAESKPLPPGP